MIGVADIGNTRTKLALYRDDGTLAGERAFATGEPFARDASALLPDGLDRAVIGSVVPAQTPVWADFLMARSNLLHVAGHERSEEDDAGRRTILAHIRGQPYR